MKSTELSLRSMKYIMDASAATGRYTSRAWRLKITRPLLMRKRHVQLRGLQWSELVVLIHETDRATRGTRRPPQAAPYTSRAWKSIAHTVQKEIYCEGLPRQRRYEKTADMTIYDRRDCGDRKKNKTDDFWFRTEPPTAHNITTIGNNLLREILGAAILFFDICPFGRQG